MKSVKIEIPTEVKNWAKDLTEKIHEEAVKQGRQAHFEYSPTNDMMGFIAQWAFNQLLQKNGIAAEADYVVGRPDKFDFLVYGQIVDVKATLTDSLFINDKQQLNRIDYYISVKFPDPDFSYCLIVGFTFGDDVKNSPLKQCQYTMAVEIPHSQLKSIQEWLEHQLMLRGLLTGDFP